MKIISYPIIFFLFGFLFFGACHTPESQPALHLNLDTLASDSWFLNDLLIYNQGGHIQGVQLYETGNKSYFILSGSSDSLAYYLVADVATKSILRIDSFSSNPYRHAGGFQIWENLLAVGVEDNYEKDKSKVLIYDIKNPLKPQLQLLHTINRTGEEKRFTAGCVAICKWQDTCLVAVGNWDTKNIDIYSLPLHQLDKSTQAFRLEYSINKDELMRTNWIDTSWYAYQNINFVSQSEDLYLVGTGRKDSSMIEVVDLFALNRNTWTLEKTEHFSWQAKDTLSTLQWGGGIRIDNHRIDVYSTSWQAKDSVLIRRYQGDKS